MNTTHEGPDAEREREFNEFRARIFEIARPNEAGELTLLLVNEPTPPTEQPSMRCRLVRTHAPTQHTATCDFRLPLGMLPSEQQIEQALEHLQRECGAPQRNAL